MRIDRCMKCMEETMGSPCPHCGYNPGTAAVNECALRPGTILNGRYLIGVLLGQGGFGMTYVAWDLMFEQKVAVKEYFPSGQVTRSLETGSTLRWYSTETARDMRESSVESFLREARKMARVSHISEVVRVRDMFHCNNTAYIVMDFIEGETLFSWLGKRGALNWAQTEEIFYPVIRALAGIHRAGLIHRDLSPDNIMLTPEGGIRILDLGAAKDLNRNSGNTSQVVAKRGFSPIEQYIERGSSNPCTDVYALAATIYYALTLTKTPQSLERAMDDTLNFDHPAFRAVPSQAVDALRHALALRARERTQDMPAFLAELSGMDPAMAEPVRTGTVRISPADAAARRTISVNAASVHAVPRQACLPVMPAVGGTVCFGSYPTETADRQDPIEWMVLDIRDGKALLLSLYGLDAGRYHETMTEVDWAGSNIRRRLNDDFLRTAFTAEQQRAIVLTKVSNGSQEGFSGYVTSGGRDTEDRIFLLSYTEAGRYFSGDADRLCVPTEYAKSRGAGVKKDMLLNGRPVGWWWLRSPGYYQNYASRVYSDGSRGNHMVDRPAGCLRPALWAVIPRR